ncbi:MAG TPA: hypothetical protein VEI58_09385 [Chthoniobacterales bacterium]|nr:hypothetical protein [Chthoniobacterales bacterium]
MKAIFRALFPVAIFAISTGSAQVEEESKLITGRQFPVGFGVAESSVSPDKRYGVLAPADSDHYDENGKPQNKVVEIGTGRVLATIEAETGLVHMNHGGILPASWSSDGSFVLWQVDGKWCPRALVLIKIENGEVIWQRDLLKLMQQEILARTRQADPKKYAAAKKRNAGSGEHFPDGFTINVSTAEAENGPLSLPLALHAELESDPKGIEGFPESAKINTELDGMIDREGKMTFKNFVH